MTHRRHTHRSRSKTTLAAAAALTAGALGAPGLAGAADLGARGFSLAGSGSSLLAYDLTSPSSVTTTAITGVADGDTLVGVAVRPQTGGLYAVGVNFGADTAQVYHLGARTGVATAIGFPAGYVDGGGFAVDLADTTYGVAFNPMVDRIRVVNAAGTNLRLNPNNGAAVDGNYGGAEGSIPGTNPDGPINLAPFSADSTAYVNRRQGVTSTTQYSISAQTDTLYIQNPPNAGTLTQPVPLKQGGAAFDATQISGLDFKADVSVTTGNSAATGKAYATVVSGGETRLVTIDLTSGDVASVGKVGDGAAVRGLAIQSEEVAGGVPAVALSGGTAIKRFNTATPGTVTTSTLTGILPGETVVGITRRLQTGQFYALGVDAGADAATLYALDPQTGALTAPFGAKGVQFTSAALTPVDLPDPATSAYGFDFNPTVDRIRLVTSTGINGRINPNNGLGVDADMVTPGTQPDGGLNGLPGGSTGLSATSYTNSFAQSLTGGVTTQYGLDPASDSLFIQNPPNVGTQTTQKVVKLGGSTLDFSLRSGFDIPSTVAVTAGSMPATGKAYATLTVGGVPSLYTIDLGTGEAAKLGDIAGGAVLESLSVGDPAPAYVPPVVPPVVVPPTAPPTTTPPNPGLPGVDIAPVLSNMTISPKNFRTGNRPRGASKKVKKGTTISFNLSEIANVLFTVERRETGRKSGSKCNKATSKNRRAKSCTRYVKVGTFASNGRTLGKNSVKFSGKLGKKTLPRARYRLTAVATDTSNKRSDSRTAQFTIVR